MSATLRGWWRERSVRRQEKHKSPLTDAELSDMRRKAWRLVLVSKQEQQKAAES